MIENKVSIVMVEWGFSALQDGKQRLARRRCVLTQAVIPRLGKKRFGANI
jgi:hypothetical protein